MNGTNPVCDRYEEPFDNCGCARCGHSKGEHYPPIQQKAASTPDEIR